MQNRSFEYQPIKQNTWNYLTAWELVNGADVAKTLHVELVGGNKFAGSAAVTVLAAQDATVVNEDGKLPVVQPMASVISIAPAFDYEAPANSLTIVRIKPL